MSPYYGFGGLTYKELRRLIRRNQFWNYLPYIAHDKDTKLYYNTDNSVGFIWECSPLYFADKSVASTMEGLLKLSLPHGSVMQFILYADPYIKPFIDRYQGLKTRGNSVLQKGTQCLSEFLDNGTRGLAQTGGIPVRNFRLFVTVKLPGDKLQGAKLDHIQSTVFDILKGSYLYPEPLNPHELLGFLFRLFNDDSNGSIPYNEDIPIGKQAILADTMIRSDWDRLAIGRKVVRVTTPKVYPNESSLMAANLSTGGIWGIKDDSNQVNSPFIITYNIVFDEGLKSHIETKCNFLLKQGAFGSFALALNKRKEEFLGATNYINSGGVFLRVLPVISVIGWDEADATSSLVRIKRLFEQQNYVMQEDKGIIPILFLSSLPFGLYNVRDNLTLLDRDFILPANAVSEMLPIQGDFIGGTQTPQIFFIGRKGQLIGLDFFDKKANNNHFFIAAESGAGKSFMMNYICQNYYAGNTIMRIIDIGGSYRKSCTMNGGKFLEFHEGSDICLNPFTNVDPKTLEDDIPTIAAIVSQMVYSSAHHNMIETENTLIKDAARWAFSKEGPDASMDLVYTFLREYPKHVEEHSGLDSVSEIARTLAFNMRDFISTGCFGKWFNGRSNLNMTEDEFIVLELEHLKAKKELFKVVTLQVLNYVTFDLYLSDRSRKRMILFDEAWQFIQEGEESRFIKEVIENGYRRARKYGGSFGVITQSILDVKNRFGAVGDVILNNSAFHIFPVSSDFDKARQEKIINYNDHQMELIKSVGSNRPKYTGMFFKTPAGNGVGRLAVDRFSFYAYNSDSDINAAIENLRRQGMNYEEAIEVMIKNNG